jgi:pyruvate dehydrogenase E2 component (dihydrolipoamide acetyltransferase)
VQPGQTIPPGALLLTLEGAEAEKVPAKAKPTEDREQKTATAKAAPAKASETRPTAKPAPTAPPDEEDKAVPPPPKQTPMTAVEQPATTLAAKSTEVARGPQKPNAAVAESAASPADGTVPAGPAIRRFAREVGVDLAHVHGTGPGGRITREDVLAVVRQASQTAASNTKAAAATERDAWGPIRTEKMSKIRKTIAAKMHESWTTCPRVTNFDDADVTELERLRVSSKDDYAKKGIKLTSLPFVIKAVASALKAHPSINAAIDIEHGQIVYKQYVNIGIAVDTERGLVVPSLRNADEMSIPDVARALAQLSDNVRDGNFQTADLQGSTFTISNLGAIGGTYSTPIINTPEVAILLVGRSRKMPVVVDDQMAIRLMMPLSLAYDHRLVDGATAARFLNEVIDYLEAPSRLLLAP